MGRKRKIKTPTQGQVVLVRHNPVFSAAGDVKWKEAIVDTLLNVQFTSILQDGTHTLIYSFYHDYGDTWKSPEDATLS